MVLSKRCCTGLLLVGLLGGCGGPLERGSLDCDSERETLVRKIENFTQDLASRHSQGDWLTRLDRVLMSLDNAINRANRYRWLAPARDTQLAANQCLGRLLTIKADLLGDPVLYDALRDYDSAQADIVTQHRLNKLMLTSRRHGAHLDQSTRVQVREARRAIVYHRFELRRSLPDVAAAGELAIMRQLASLPAEDARALYRRHFTESYPQALEHSRALVAARQTLAQSLGYPHYLQYALDTTMARLPAAVDRALQETEGKLEAELQAVAGAPPALVSAEPVPPWEWPGVRQRWLHARVGHQQRERIRDYLRYESLEAGLFEWTARVFGVELLPAEARPSEPLWHPSVRVFDVFENGQPQGRLYLDTRARPHKRPGFHFLPLKRGVKDAQLPAGVISASLPGPAARLEPAQAQALFQAYGRFLYLLFASDQSAWTDAGLSAERDFLPVPGQVFAGQFWRWDTITRLARNSAGEPIPASLREPLTQWRRIERLIRLRRQLHRYDRARTLYGDAAGPASQNGESPADRVFWARRLAECHTLCYEELWAGRLAQEVAREFNQWPASDPVTARRFRSQVLAKGSTRSARDLVTDFLD